MNDFVVKIVLKKESKVSKCKEMIDLISKSENVKSVLVERELWLKLSKEKRNV